MSYPLTAWNLPPVWRSIFPEIDSLGGSGPTYDKLCGFADGGLKALASDLVEVWDVDQDSECLTATLRTGGTISAKVTFLGAHDGRTFRWADANTSISHALACPAQTLSM